MLPGIAILSRPDWQLGEFVNTDAGDKKLYWRSRRGMLELDLQLVPFLTRRYPDLSPEQKAAYAALLEHEDWQIFDWLQGREQPQDAATRELVRAIRDADDR